MLLSHDVHTRWAPGFELIQTQGVPALAAHELCRTLTTTNGSVGHNYEDSSISSPPVYPPIAESNV